MSGEPSVAIATCAQIPGGDEDAPALIRALVEAGLHAESVVWDAAEDWSRFDLVVVRSTWDYAKRRPEFLQWAAEVSAKSSLLNPIDVLKWSTDKVYLLELQTKGVSIVDTHWIQPGARIDLPDHEELVVKPSVSAGSKDTARYRRSERERIAAHVAMLHGQGRTAMVQPYEPSVDDEGETAVMYIGGRFSHAVRKGPLLSLDASFEEGLFAPEDIRAIEAPKDVLDLVSTTVQALPFDVRDLLYARFDVVRRHNGVPAILEAELCEPSLFLQHRPNGFGRMVESISAHLPGRP